MDMEYAGGWVPSEGDVLVGTVIGLDIGWSKYPKPNGSNYPIITVSAKDGSTSDGESIAGEDVAVHCFHVGLRNKLITLKPMLGEEIGVQYKGKRPSRTDPTNEVAQYVVRIKGRTADVWGALAPQVQVQQPQTPASGGGFTPHDVPADTSDFAPAAQTDDTDDIPF
jgi:hypothetical protein